MPKDKQQADIQTLPMLDEYFFFYIYIHKHIHTGQSFVIGHQIEIFSNKRNEPPDTCKSFLDKRRETEGLSFIISDLPDLNEQ